MGEINNNNSYNKGITICKDYGSAKRVVTLTNMYTEKKHRSFSEKNSVNEDKLKNNLIRAKNKILEYGLCNSWDYFFTVTIDPQKHDRSNLDDIKKAFTSELHAIGRSNNIEIKYLIVPELHSDLTNWHLHGLISGLPIDYLRKFTLHDEKLPNYIRNKLKNGYAIYEFIKCTEKIGFNDFEMIRDLKKTVNYIIKYMSKDVGRSVTQMGKHLYYASKGLNRAKEIARVHLPLNTKIKYDYENAYAKIKWYDNDEYIESMFFEVIEVDSIEDLIELLSKEQNVSAQAEQKGEVNSLCD